MSPLYVPFWKRTLGSAVGWTLYGLLRALYALPRPVLQLAITAISVVTKAIVGETAASRALDFIRQILRSGDNTATVLNRVVTRSRPDDFVSIVRGVIIRRLS